MTFHVCLIFLGKPVLVKTSGEGTLTIREMLNALYKVFHLFSKEIKMVNVETKSQ